MKLITVSLVIFLSGALVTTAFAEGDNLCSGFAPFVEKQPFDEIVADLPFDRGMVFQLKADNGTPIGLDTYYLETGSVFRATYQVQFIADQIGNEQVSIRYITLLNETQISTIENSPIDLYYDITLEVGKSRSFDIVTPPLAEGIYDLILLGIPYSGEMPIYGFSSYVYPQRMTIIVGNSQASAPLPYQPASATGLVSEGANSPLLYMTLDKTFRYWNAPETTLALSKGTNFTFYIKAGYLPFPNADRPEPGRSQFVLILFDNYHQIYLNDRDKNLYLEVAPDTEYAELPVTLSFDTGYHDLLGIRIDNPRVPFCILNYSPSGANLILSMITIQRVGVIVE